MYIQHSPAVWAEHPDLVAGAVFATGITDQLDAGPVVARYAVIAADRLAARPESELPEIQAWRRAFARMGLKPTQYRCAAESLLRRYRKEGSLPAIHPLIDVCNAISLAYAIPVAALDVSRIADWIEIRPAGGDEDYLTFSGQTEHPDPGEVTFVDAMNRAHARRWTNRQSGYSAVRASTSTVLIIAEALHGMAAADVSALTAALGDDLTDLGSAVRASAILTSDAPRFVFEP